MPTSQPELKLHEILIAPNLIGLLVFFSFWYGTSEGQSTKSPCITRGAFKHEGWRNDVVVQGYPCPLVHYIMRRMVAVVGWRKGLPRFPNDRNQNQKEIPRFLYFQTSGFLDFWMFRFLDYQISEFLDFWIFGILGNWIFQFFIIISEKKR